MNSLYDLVQIALPILTEIPKPRLIEEAEIKACANYGDAVRLCLKHRIRRLNESEIARCLGFMPPHLVKVKNGKGYLSSDQEVMLQRLCSNWAIQQYQEMREREMAELMNDQAETPEQMIQRMVDERFAKAFARAAA